MSSYSRAGTGDHNDGSGDNGFDSRVVHFDLPDDASLEAELDRVLNGDEIVTPSVSISGVITGHGPQASHLFSRLGSNSSTNGNGSHDNKSKMKKHGHEKYTSLDGDDDEEVGEEGDDEAKRNGDWRMKNGNGERYAPLEIGDGAVEDGERRRGDGQTSEEAEQGLLAANGHTNKGEHHTNIWAMENIAIAASYFCVGCSIIPVVPVSYYLVHELDASPAEQNVIVTLTMLPWSLKLFYGFLSDNFPIWGHRRKPYFILGWTVYVSCLLYLAYLHRPTVFDISLFGFGASLGFMLSDVTTDAVVVERSKDETEEEKGSMQATGYALRFIGRLIGSILGTMLHNKATWGWGLSIAQIYFLTAMVPIIFIGPATYPLLDPKVSMSGGWTAVKHSSVEIFATLSKTAIYVPMSFVFIYNAMQVSNSAWRSFLVDGLEFTNLELGTLAIVGSLFSSIGIVSYKRYFFHTSWRKVYIVTTILSVFFSILQLLLIYRINLKMGIGDLAFALGDDALAEFVGAIQFLPVVQMYLGMCPAGAEGSTYAIVTTLGNVAGTIAYTISTALTGIWDVSNDAIKAGDYDGMAKLTILTSMMQPLPLMLIGLIPATKQIQRVMQRSSESSALGGGIFLFVIFASLALTLYEAHRVISAAR